MGRWRLAWWCLKLHLIWNCAGNPSDFHNHAGWNHARACKNTVCNSFQPLSLHLCCQKFPSCNVPGNMQKRQPFHLEKLKSTQLQWAKLLPFSPGQSKIDVLMLFSFGNKILPLSCRYLFSLCSSIVTGIKFKMFKTPKSSKGSVRLHFIQKQVSKLWFISEVACSFTLNKS